MTTPRDWRMGPYPGVSGSQGQAAVEKQRRQAAPDIERGLQGGVAQRPHPRQPRGQDAPPRATAPASDRRAEHGPRAADHRRGRGRGRERTLPRPIPALAYTGLRIGEALALEWQHVDVTGKRVLVRQTTTRRTTPPLWIPTFAGMTVVGWGGRGVGFGWGSLNSQTKCNTRVRCWHGVQAVVWI